MENRNILTVQNLNVYYREKKKIWEKNPQKKQVCKDICFSIKQGEIVGVLGESGCGKSTLAKAIMGLIKDYEGMIVHASENPQMVFQDPYSSLNPSKKIGWILEEPLKIKGGYTKEERKKEVADMLKRVGLLEKHAEHYPSELSGGQRQRVCIAAALMLKPWFLIADEPVSALDVTVQAQIVKLLLKLKEEMGLSILFISHDLRIVYQMSDRVLVMRQGEIVEQGLIEEVYESPKTEYMKNLLEASQMEEKE